MPTGLWLIWYLGWGHNAETFISFTNFATSPSYVLDGLSPSLATWLGPRDPRDDVSPLDWGRPLLVVALGLVGLAALRHPATLRPADRRGCAGCSASGF